MMLAFAPRAAAEGVENAWTMAGGDYANTRFSTLGQITAENVKGLQLAWKYENGVKRGQEAAPLVVGDTMYVVSPWPNYLDALDVVTGKLKWRYDPKPSAAAKGQACCDWVNRGACYSDGVLYYNTLDCRTVAVDAASGREMWKVKLGDIAIGETMTMAPLVVKGKVIVGNSGGEYGVRGWVTALDAKTGKVAWRAYNTGPDAECLIGPRFKPFYPAERGKDLGVHSWPADHWKIGGGTVWGFISYDPELNLIYYGTGNPGPWNPELRPGDNKWTCGIFARDADTGEAVWYYQSVPHDTFDHDGINECILLELKVDGAEKPTRKVLVQPGRTGFMYVLDRATGELLSAEAYGRVTWASGVDLKTGRPKIVADKEPQQGKVIRDVSPASPGMKDWQPSAFSLRTGWLYVPHQNITCDFESTEVGYIAGTPYVGVNERMYAGPGGHRGVYMAWDPVAKKEVWSVKEPFPVWSGTLATAGDVVFYGTMDRKFKALHARTGELLWSFETESGIIGQPTTFLGPDGKQYVAILAGIGGWSASLVPQQVDTRDATAVSGFANLLKDLPKATPPGDTLYVFKLP